MNKATKKCRAPRSLKKVNLDLLNKKFMTSLEREANNLLDLTYNGKLEKEDAISLNNYLKLVRDLKKLEDEALLDLTDEELEKIAAKE